MQITLTTPANLPAITTYRVLALSADYETKTVTIVCRQFDVGGNELPSTLRISMPFAAATSAIHGAASWEDKAYAIINTATGATGTVT